MNDMNDTTNSVPALTNDEWRLVRMFRCLSRHGRWQVMFDVGQQAMERCFPDRSLCDFMPMAGGVEPEKVEGGTIVEILHNGIHETGEPMETLLGSSDCDEEEVFPRFAHGASETALKLGSFFDYDERFARKYIPAWRWEIVFACERAAKVLAAEETDAGEV